MTIFYLLYRLTINTNANTVQCRGLKLIIFPTKDGLKGERLELVAIAVIELVLELHPVQPEGVQEGREPLHHQQDPNGQHCMRGEET